MTQTNYVTHEIWTTGRRQCDACVTATVYPRIIVATACDESITERQMEKALNRKFPRHTFVFNGLGGHYIRCDADRWPGDGV